MAKRKRDRTRDGVETQDGSTPKKPKTAATPDGFRKVEGVVTIQIVAGSYDRVLHGVTATIVPSMAPIDEQATEDVSTTDSFKVKFSDTFLFNAHSSAIRCLALSPPSAPVPGQTPKVLLATGSTDERINLYNLSVHPPPSANAAGSVSNARARDEALLESLAPRSMVENPKHRELGTLLHHRSTVTRLAFPVRGKLLSASEDSTVAVTRTRDWTQLHAFRCPIPKAMGRPSGDTATVPSGVNDFAVHPSLKIMISVSKGERCMRLWNLVTGKKEGVHNFGRELLAEIGEGRHAATGEARKIAWGSCGGEDEFAVGFDRDAVVYGMDIKPRCRLMKDQRTKCNELRYVKVDEAGDDSVLAVSTDDGRILFFSTKVKQPEEAEGEDGTNRKMPLRNAQLVAQLGGVEAGVSGRIKDFTVLPYEAGQGVRGWYVVAGNSDGKLRVWQLDMGDLQIAGQEQEAKNIGRLLGAYDTPHRITCLGAFIMVPRPDGAENEYDEAATDSDGVVESD